MKTIILKEIYVLITPLYLTVSIVTAQVAPVKEWDNTVIGLNCDYPGAVFQLDDGNFLVAGFGDSPQGGDKSKAPKGSHDYWLVKINQKGNVIDDFVYGGSAGDLLYSANKNSDGGYILGGYSYSNKSADKSEDSNGDAHYWIINIGSNYEKKWDKTFGGSRFDYLASVFQLSDGWLFAGWLCGITSGRRHLRARLW